MNDCELIIKMSGEEIERIKELLVKDKRVRHYLLKIFDNEELDVVEYKEYEKLQQRINEAIKLLDNYQNNLYSRETRKTLDDDIEWALSILQGKEVEN